MDSGTTATTSFYTEEVFYDPNWSTYYKGKVRAYDVRLSYVWNPFLKKWIPLYTYLYSEWDEYPVSIWYCTH